MSTEEQMTMIGRLSVERAEARRECALLESELAKIREKLGSVQSGLSCTGDSRRMAALMGDVEGLIASGGFDRIRKALSELQVASQKITDIGQTLRNAGAD